MTGKDLFLFRLRSLLLRQLSRVGVAGVNLIADDCRRISVEYSKTEQV